MTTAAESWRNPRILALLLLVFLCGGIAGALTMRVASGTVKQKQGPAWREGGKEISLQRFKRELDLNEEQAQQMEIVLDDFVTYYQSLQAQMDDVRATGKSRIIRILNDEQRRKFEQMIAGLQARQLR